MTTLAGGQFRSRRGRLWVLLVAVALIAAVGVAACGGDDEAAAPPPPPPPAELAPAEGDPAAAEARATVRAILDGLIAQAGGPDVKSDWPEIVDSACFPPKLKPEGPLKVGYAYASRSNTWQIQNGDGGIWYLENHPDVGEVIGTDGEENPDKQIGDIQSLIAQEVDLMIVNPATTAVSPAVQQACDAGIPVLVYDRFVEPETNVTATMYADEIHDGYTCGSAIVEALDGEGNVVILGGLPGVGVSEERMIGARQAFDEAPGVTVLAEAFSDYDPAKGRQIMEEWLQAHDQIDALWSDAGLQAIGAIGALQEAGRFDEVKMIAGGQFNRFLRFWNDLGFNGCGATISSDVGIITAQLGIDIVRGDILPMENIPGPLVVITNETLGNFYRADLPDDYWASAVLPESLLQQIYGQ